MDDCTNAYYGSNDGQHVSRLVREECYVSKDFLLEKLIVWEKFINYTNVNNNVIGMINGSRHNKSFVLAMGKSTSSICNSFRMESGANISSFLD